jgi:hypothetical protein
MSNPRLRIRNFAHLDDVDIRFGDLTTLVGAQGTGKSIALQWLKVSVDGRQITDALKDAGAVDDPDVLIDLVFGVGMGSGWSENSDVRFGGRSIRPKNVQRQGDGVERVFFIPAHRAMLVSDGWAAPFQKLTADTPVVARLFSQNLFDRFNRPGSRALFPQDRLLKKIIREQIDSAVFHGGTVALERDERHARRLKLSHGDTQLPFMTWTAGQREFTPLLLGLYHLLPPRKNTKVPGIDWVVIEEPEMGLHPRAIMAFMLLVLDLMWRGYRVVLSTHSPLIVHVLYALRELKEQRARWQLVCDGLGIEPKQRRSLKAVAERALEAEYRTFLLHFGPNGRVRSKDVSSLDPASDDADVAGWGGLSGFSAQLGDAVRQAALDFEAANS